MHLSHDRPLSLGYGVAVYGSIPFVSINAFAGRYGLRGADEFDRFLALIRAMDEAFLSAVNKKAK